MGNTLKTISTYELTYLSMEPNTYDDTQMFINILNFSSCKQFVLLKNNDNYKQICEKLKSGMVYKFVTYTLPYTFDVYVDNVLDQSTYTTEIKIAKLVALDMNIVAINFDNVDSCKVTCDNGEYPATNYYSELKFITENKNDIIVGKYYKIKFKKHTYGRIYYIFEYELV